MKMTAAEVARLIGGSLVDCAPDIELTGFATDSRQAGAGLAFLAIRGANVDGHDFVHQALQSGSPVSVVERLTEGPQILVPNLVDALARGAAELRNKFDGPVIAVTGSNGKTTTKEFVVAAVMELGPVLSSAGNRNTEFTSPQVWFDLTPEHRVAVVEMGMRGFGQIAHLAAFARPTIGIVTNIGTAHVEMVGSRAGIAKAKSELLAVLPGDGFAILPADDEFLADLRATTIAQSLTFGYAPEADVQIQGYRSEPDGTSRVRLSWRGSGYDLQIPMIGRHQAANAAAAFLAAVCAGVEPSAAAARIADAKPPEMRMQVGQWHHCTILMDAYNASPDSTIAALRTLVEMPSDGPRVAVLGEMKELGDSAESGHRAVGRVIAEGGIDAVIFIGPDMSYAAKEAIRGGYPESRITCYEGRDYVQVRDTILNLTEGSTVLIKGSRSLAMEQILEEGR